VLSSKYCFGSFELGHVQSPVHCEDSFKFLMENRDHFKNLRWLSLVDNDIKHEFVERGEREKMSVIERLCYERQLLASTVSGVNVVFQQGSNGEGAPDLGL